MRLTELHHVFHARQTSLAQVPSGFSSAGGGTQLILITAIVRSHRLEAVKTAIADLGVTGMSVVEVRGAGNAPERAANFAGREVLVSLPIRAKITVVVHQEQQEALIQAILSAAQTGEPGDGKIFVEPVLNAIRIRTLERGETAV